jgi:glutamate synthase (NADPH) small chain
LEEVEHAMGEELNFLFLTNPLEIIGSEDVWVKQICCQKMRFTEPDASGRQKPVPIENIEFIIRCKLCYYVNWYFSESLD